MNEIKDFDIIGEMNAPKTIDSKLFEELQKEFLLDNVFNSLIENNKDIVAQSKDYDYCF